MPRYFLVTVILGLLGLCIIAKAAYIMFVERDYWNAVSDRFVKENVAIEPVRGNIFSADGQLLAGSLPEYKIYMDFMSWEKDSLRRVKDQHRRDSLLDAKMDSVCDGMHRLFPDIDPREFEKLLREGRRRKSHHWLLYPKRISYIQYKEVKRLPYFSLSSNQGGFHVEDFPQRRKPFGSLAARTIGEMYGGKDTARFGLELAFDSVLRGKPGIKHRQKVMNRYLNMVDVPAEDGYDVETTLDVGMQDICEKALRDKLTEISANSGVCILMEVATGNIKAITTLTRCADGKYREVRNGAVSDLREPGSVFKPVSFMVAMDDGYIDMNTRVNTGNGVLEMYGQPMKDHNWTRGGYGELTVPEILEYSSNIGVSYLIDKYYHNDPNKFVDGVYRTGIAEDTRLPIPGYARPNIRHPRPDGKNWSPTALPWMSIGYETQIPPINTLMFYNGIANGGRMVRPRLVTRLMRGGETVREYPVEVVREHMCKPQTLTNLQTILEWVVSRGLGRQAGNRNFKVSGKTGTAQVWTAAGFSSQYLVSFAGYFPSDAPLYSCIVCIQKGYPASGGGHCGPVFRRVSESVMALRTHPAISSARDTLHVPAPLVKNGNIEAAARLMKTLGVDYESIELNDGLPVWGRAVTQSNRVVLERCDETPGQVPDVTGMGARDAVFLLEKSGLRTTLRGIGHVVRQSIAPGTPLSKGKTIHLQLEQSGVPAENVKIRPVETKTDTVKTSATRTGGEATEVGALADTTRKKTVKSKKTTAKETSGSQKKQTATQPKEKPTADRRKTSAEKKKNHSN